MRDPNKILSFIRIRGKIIPIKKSSFPKIKYHQTTEEAKKSILKKGFDSKILGSRSTDNLPDGVYLKSSNRDIGLKGKEQLSVFSSNKSKAYFRDRNDFDEYVSSKSEKIKSLMDKEKRIDSFMSKKSDKLFDKVKKQRDSIRKKTGDIQKARLTKGKMDRFFYRWRELNKTISKEIRDESTALFRKEGKDSVVILRDEGSFGRFTDTEIVFDDKKVKPLKKWLKLNRNK